MLSQDTLGHVADKIAKRFSGVETLVLTTVAKRIREIGEVLPSDATALARLTNIGSDISTITLYFQQQTGLAANEIQQIYQATAIANLEFARKFYAAQGRRYIPYANNAPLQRIVEAQTQLTANALENLSNTTVMNGGQGKNYMPIDRAYRRMVDLAVSAVQAGVGDYNAAVHDSIARMARAGVKTVEYASGVHRRLDSAARMNIIDGVRAVNQDVARQIGAEFGADGVELSAHMTCAPDHLPMQGRQFAQEEFNALQTQQSSRDYQGHRYDAIRRPIGMWNCRHFAYPIVLGVSEPIHTDGELERIREDNEKTINIAGKQMTAYEASQLMRKIETQIRKAKNEAVTFGASGDAFSESMARDRVRVLTAKYQAVAQAANQRMKYARIRVPGYKTSAPPLQSELNSDGYRGIIERDGNREYMRILDAHGQEKYRYLHTDAIQNLDSSEAIRKHFEYADKFGDKYSPITQEFGEFKIDIQKEIAEGLEWARTTYKLDRLPAKITRETGRGRTTGAYNPVENKIYFRPRISLNDAFATAVHEMTHYTARRKFVDPDGICNQALRNLKIRGKTKAERLQREVAGLTNSTRDWDTPDELVAYSLEREATNRQTTLSTEIAKLFMEAILK
nr:MAG TPA: minor capsid protein [Caudoviricetes sp.]